jgi:hypothetical protein
MARRGVKDPGDDALAKLDTSAEVDERDLKEGERRKSGQAVAGAEKEDEDQGT